MPTDAIKMGIDHDTLIDPTMVGGMGGDAACFQEIAVLVFDEPNRNLTQYYYITMMIPEVHQDLMRMPSLLGRDILDRWRMNYDPSRNGLKFTVRSADHTIKVASP